jgi:hypothetical protein
MRGSLVFPIVGGEDDDRTCFGEYRSATFLDATAERNANLVFNPWYNLNSDLKQKILDQIPLLPFEVRSGNYTANTQFWGKTYLPIDGLDGLFKADMFRVINFEKPPELITFNIAESLNEHLRYYFKNDTNTKITISHRTPYPRGDPLDFEINFDDGRKCQGTIEDKFNVPKLVNTFLTSLTYEIIDDDGDQILIYRNVDVNIKPIDESKITMTFIDESKNGLSFDVPNPSILLKPNIEHIVSLRSPFYIEIKVKVTFTEEQLGWAEVNPSAIVEWNVSPTLHNVS